MKVICDGLDLSDAVSVVSKALAVKSANPVLEGILLTASGDTLTLLATNMELTIEKKIRAEVLMEGSTVVVGKYFVDFVQKLEKEQVELSQLYDSQLQIKYSSSESELQIFPAESFPKFDKKGQENFFEISQADFKKVVERTTIACSTDDSRPILKGCLFEINDNKLTAVALDGFRMAVAKLDVISSGNFKSIIPKTTLDSITRLLDNEDKIIRVFIENNSLYVEVENTRIFSRLIEGEFVKYNHILPSNFTNTVLVNRDALISSLSRASIVARNDRYNVIKFDVKEEIMNVSAKSEVGFVVENVNINLKGKDITIAFNGKYVADYLRIMNEEFIKINMNSPIDPCVITPSDSENFIYLVLPVRITA